VRLRICTIGLVRLEQSNQWHRTLWAMVSVQIIVSGAFSIVPPVIPLILPTLGVTAPQDVRAWAGVLMGVTPLAAALMSPQWGRLADRVDRRSIILVSCTAAAICTASMSLATSPWQMLALRFTMGLFGGHVAAALYIVSDAAPSHRLGWSLGWLATGQLAGMLLGPLMGGFIADASGSLRAPFLFAGAASILIGGATALVPAAPPRTLTHQPRRLHVSHWLRNPRSRGVRSLVVVILLTQCAIMATQPVISLRVRELVGARPGLATLAGLAFSVVGLSGLLAAPVLGAVSDRAGAPRLLFFIVVAAIACVMPQAYATFYEGFVIERFLAGLFLCSVIPIANALIGKIVSAQDRGKAFGLASGAAFLGACVGPLSGGLLGAWFGLVSVFLFSSAILMVNLLWIGVSIWPAKQTPEITS